MKTLLVLSLLCSLFFCGAAPAEKAQVKKAAAKKSAAKKSVPKKAPAQKLAPANKDDAPAAEDDAPKKNTPAPAPAPAPKVQPAPVPAPPVPPPPRNITLDFRGGKVLCAEISSQRPPIKGFNEKNFLNLPARRVYAALTVLCDADRSLSIYDYCLDHYGIFPCVALKEGNGEFVSSPEKVLRVNPKTKYTLLFILDAAVAGNDIELCCIKALCDDGPFSKQLIPFKNLKDKSFTPPGRVPLTGLIPEKK